MSINGSIAKIGPIKLKEDAMPTPDKPTDAAIVAVPGIPAIPSEPNVTTIIVMTIMLKSITVPVKWHT